jgi:hypothetical protein
MRTSLLLAPLALLALAACDSPAGPQARALLNPTCAHPAPVLREPDAALPNRWVVVYHDTIDSRATTAVLAQRHGFTPRFVYEHALRGFSADLSAEALSGVRCENAVRYAAGDAVVTIGF